MDFFRNAVKERLLEDEKEEKKYYRVQVGAFSTKSNAEALLDKVEATGFRDAIIKKNNKQPLGDSFRLAAIFYVNIRSN